MKNYDIRQLNVLLVEKHNYMRRIMRNILSEMGVESIVVTANTEIRHVMTTRDTGMTEFLAKPISAGMIYSRICSIIERQRLFICCQDFLAPTAVVVGWDLAGPNVAPIPILQRSERITKARLMAQKNARGTPVTSPLIASFNAPDRFRS